MTLYVKEIIQSGNLVTETEVPFPSEITETFGSLYQNASSPIVFSANNVTPTPWNNTNAGAIEAGNSNSTTVDTTTGEITLDDAGEYELEFEGSVASDNASVQLCMQVFIDGVGQDNMCDFPATHPVPGKYTPFSGGDITKLPITTGQKVSVRFISLEPQAENIKLRNLNLKVRRKK